MPPAHRIETGIRSSGVAAWVSYRSPDAARRVFDFRVANENPAAGPIGSYCDLYEFGALTDSVERIA